MKRRLVTALIAVGLLASAGVLVSCGADEEELDVPEGEPVHLGELLYSVQITRFLNPDDVSDASYLSEQPPAAEGSEYLAVFLRIENEGSEPVEIADELTVTDSRDNEFEALETESPFALDLGRTVEPDGELPEPGSPAASGPIKGAMVLFEIPDPVTENRPLELEIPGHGETGRVELDL